MLESEELGDAVISETAEEEPVLEETISKRGAPDEEEDMVEVTVDLDAESGASNRVTLGIESPPNNDEDEDDENVTTELPP